MLRDQRLLWLLSPKTTNQDGKLSEHEKCVYRGQNVEGMALPDPLKREKAGSLLPWKSSWVASALPTGVFTSRLSTGFPNLSHVAASISDARILSGPSCFASVPLHEEDGLDLEHCSGHTRTKIWCLPLAE